MLPEDVVTTADSNRYFITYKASVWMVNTRLKNDLDMIIEYS